MRKEVILGSLLRLGFKWSLLGVNGKRGGEQAFGVYILMSNYALRGHTQASDDVMIENGY